MQRALCRLIALQRSALEVGQFVPSPVLHFACGIGHKVQVGDGCKKMVATLIRMRWDIPLKDDGEPDSFGEQRLPCSSFNPREPRAPDDGEVQMPRFTFCKSIEAVHCSWCSCCMRQSGRR